MDEDDGQGNKEEQADVLQYEAFDELKVGCINYASLPKFAKHIPECECDILVVPESRLTQDDCCSMTVKCETMGFSMIAAVARVEEGRPKAEGISILARRPLRVIELAIPDELQEWHQQGRLLIGQIIVPGGAGLTIVAWYAHAGHRWHREQEQSHLDCVEALSRWKVAKNIRRCILAGDLNSGPGDTIYESCMASSLWFDPHATQDTQRPPTFVSMAGTSVIDHVLCDQELITLCSKAETAEGSPVQHRLVSVSVRIPCQEDILQPCLPRFEPLACKPCPTESTPGWTWDYGEWELELAVRKSPGGSIVASMESEMGRVVNVESSGAWSHHIQG